MLFKTYSKQLVCGTDDFLVKIWDVGTKTLINSLSGLTHGITAICYSKHIVSSDSNGAIRIWNTDGKLIHTIETTEYNKYIKNLCFSTDGSKIISVGNTIVKIWNLDTYELISKSKYCLSSGGAAAGC